jgi:hypothetical protein
MKEMKIRIAAAVLGSWMACVAVPLFAHHSFQSTFDIDRRVQIEGNVTQVNWGNPHASFDVTVVDSKTGTSSWRVELPSPNAMIRGGWNRNSISVGSTVIVGGYAAKSGEQLIGAAVVTMKVTGRSTAIPVEQSWKRPERLDERYNATDPVQLIGKVVSVERVDPIPSVHIAVISSIGVSQDWIVGTVSTFTLDQIGWKESSLAPGDVIQVNGLNSMSGARKVFAVKVLVIEKGGKTLPAPIALLNSTPLIP